MKTDLSRPTLAALAALAVLVLVLVLGTRGDAAPGEAGALALDAGPTAPADTTEVAGAPGAAGPAETPASTGPVTLPADVEWETNFDDPPIGAAEALRGGTFNYFLSSYPMTFRLMGPNSNDAFAGWNRAFTMGFGLVSRHPVTDNYIPWMATHWSVQEDQRTLFFRLDPDARFSDGTPITADDYVFTLEMMRSEHIVDPFYNSYAERFYESIDRIDDYTLRIVGTRPSWRPLSDYGGIWPTPRHAVTLDADWVSRTQNQPQVAVGPYIVSDVSRGESVTFQRLPEWWGDGKHYFQGMYNVDRIHLRVIPAERSLDFLRRGEIDLMQETSARRWNEEYAFPAVRNNWIRRARIFVDTPSGVYGMHLNLEAPIFQNHDFRKAVQYLFNFDRLNRNLMFDEYFRQSSFFEGTEYANPAIRPYPFDPQRAREHLERAGFRRPSEVRRGGFLGRIANVFRGLVFTRTDTDDILVDGEGRKASFTLIYGSKGLERHLTVMQQEYRRAGIDVRLRLLEPGTAFERGLERKYEATVTGRTAGFYPSPRQYLHTEFRDAVNNNNIWGFGTEEVDELIEIYEDDLDFEARRAALHRIDEIVFEEAFYVPFWRAPFVWAVHWDYVVFPEFYLPKRVDDLTEYMLFWIDPQRRDALQGAMREGRPLPPRESVDVDYYGVREQL